MRREDLRRIWHDRGVDPVSHRIHDPDTHPDRGTGFRTGHGDLASVRHTNPPAPTRTLHRVAASEAPNGPVRAAAPQDLPAIREMLTRAFHDDPQFAWLMPSELSRSARMRRFFGTLLRVEGFGLADIDVVGTGGKITGVAVWFRPGTWPPPMARQLRALPGYIRAFGRRTAAASVLVNVAARAHPKTEYWYLACIGVEPSTQGKGVGAALLRSRLALCDAQGAVAFLESSKPTNVQLYAHFGFVAGAPLRLPPGAPEITPMTRPPRAGAVGGTDGPGR